MKNYLAISALGPNDAGWFHPFSKAIVSCGCNILNTKMTVFGEQAAMVLHLSGNWGAIAKLEALLPGLERKFELSSLSKRTPPAQNKDSSLLYQAHIVALDKSGILDGLLDFFMEQNISIQDISAHTHASTTGTQMVTINIQVNILPDMHVSSIREQFLTHCDNLNLDASFDIAEVR